MEDTLNLICELLKTHDRVLCYPEDKEDEDKEDKGGFNSDEDYITYKKVIPIYVRELTNSLDLDSDDVDNCDTENNINCEHYPRCYCHNLLELWTLEKISDTSYRAKAYLHASKIECDFIYPTINKINGRWYIQFGKDCEEYELLL